MKMLTKVVQFLSLITLVLGILLKDCDFKKPSSFNFRQAKRNANTYCQILKNGDSHCMEEIKPYFKEIKETEDSIKQYTEFCHYIRSNSCTRMINYFKGLCYDMKRTAEILTLIPDSYKELILDDARRLRFRLDYLTWKVLSVNQVNVHFCWDLFLNETRKNDLIKAIDEYNKWFMTNSGGNCNCIELYGLYQINFSNSFEADPGLMKLKSKFTDFCINNNHAWTAKQFQQIVNETKIDNKQPNNQGNIGYEDVRKFLKLATSIGRAGWCQVKICWSFKVILGLLNETFDNVSYKEKADLIADAIKVHFTPDNYNDFINTTNIDGFNSVECRRNILIESFSQVGLDKEKNFWKNNDKKYFIEHLRILIQIFKKNDRNKNCETFSKKLKILCTKIKEKTVNIPKLTQIIETVSTSGKSFDDMTEMM